MSSNFGYIDIILLAMIAGFIILRLRSILGRKTGHEDKIYPRFSEKNFKEFGKQQEVKPKNKNSNELEGEDKEKFIRGAEIAYETIITAFAKGDKKSLKNLLTPEMSNNFDQAISERDSKGIKSELTFISMKESSLEKYEKIQKKSRMKDSTNTDHDFINDTSHNNLCFCISILPSVPYVFGKSQS